MMRNGATNRISNNSNASCNNTKNENVIQFWLKGEAYGLCLLFSSPVILYSLDTIVEIGNWHRFSNFVLTKLLVGCQWVIEPILSPLLHKLIHTWVGSNSGTNLNHLFLYFQIFFKIILKLLILQVLQTTLNDKIIRLKFII